MPGVFKTKSLNECVDKYRDLIKVDPILSIVDAHSTHLDFDELASALHIAMEHCKEYQLLAADLLALGKEQEQLVADLLAFGKEQEQQIAQED